MRKERICRAEGCTNILDYQSGRGLCGKCYSKARHSNTLARYEAHSPKERFMENVLIDEVSGCHLWLRKLDAKGYGVLHYKGKARFAHHVAMMLFRDISIPKGYCVCHKCDNPKCVNPNHLFIGTQRDNIHDMISKGRKSQVVGERVGRAKISDEQAMYVLLSDKTAKELARELNVTDHAIYRIKRGQTFKHLSR